MERERRNLGCSLFAVVLVSALACSDVWAQATAQITGTVTDQSGAVLPGVDVTVTQTATGFMRNVVTNEAGLFVIPNLPIGPYQLAAMLQGFRTYSQTGIVLQVGSNPVINVALELGELSESVTVTAAAALVETRSTGIGQVIDNTRVLEMPLQGRQVQQLIILSGAAVGGGAAQTARGYPADAISVAGGSTAGLAYQLDGGTHNEPANNLNYPLPFPDALEEFRVETSAVPAQYGHHAAGIINAVTKSGTNAFHGSAFEFTRNKAFNEKNAFATQKDNLKRNQFGGVLGGPIVRNKLFFFVGHQATVERSTPPDLTAFVPTARMLAGDWTIVASPACAGRQIALRAPFVNSRVDPALFSGPALNLVKRFPTPLDECGTVKYGQRVDLDEHIVIGKLDYQQSAKHSMFGRYQLARLDQPDNYDDKLGESAIGFGEASAKKRAHSTVIGDTYSVGFNFVNSFRATIIRASNDRILERDLFTFSDLGVKGVYYPQEWVPLGRVANISVSGAFSTSGTNTPPAVTPTWTNQVNEDLTWLRGAHQLGFGANFIHSRTFYTSGSSAHGNMTFAADNTGLSLGDFMLGRARTWQQGEIEAIDHRQNYIGLYAQDTWQTNPHLTLNGGVRWEPFLWTYDPNNRPITFKREWFDQGIRSTVFPNAPAGVLYAGDPGRPDTDAVGSPERHWKRAAPRVGVAYDPKGNGRMAVRAAYGILFDSVNLLRFLGTKSNYPRGARVVVDSPPGGFEDPWLGYPGGNPFPIPADKTNVLPARFAALTFVPDGIKLPYIHQWNTSFQTQLGANWLVAANYIGIRGRHQINTVDSNAAVLTPGATTRNTNERRVLYLQNPAQGQFYGSFIQVNDEGTSEYNGFVLSLQRRRTRGLTVLTNYTLSRCTDYGNVIRFQNNGEITPERRHLNRGHCELDRRHNYNLSTVYEIPQFGNSALRAIAGCWQVSGIVKYLSGPYLTVLSGVDTALSGTLDRWPNQVLPSPYAEDKSAAQWLNPAAFELPPTGQYGTTGRSNVVGPGSFRIDMGLTRRIRLADGHSLELRLEAFNVTNRVNLLNPVLTLTDAKFGQILTADDPRIMQLAVKYTF